ncbi:MAG: COR domain-containing protein [Saprospiraceae bacterium]
MQQSRNHGIRTIPKFISRLKYLRKLYLSHNQISNLPPFIRELRELEELFLEGNMLTSLPKEITQLTNLMFLDISENEFKILPYYIGDIQNLRELRINRNQLTTLPSSIGNLKNLTELHAIENEIESLPNEFGGAEKLEKLYLQKNFLNFLPTKIRQLSNLEVLYLDDNLFVHLPKQIGELKNIHSISVRNNKLETLPKEILNLEKLERLDVSGNPKLYHPPLEIANQGVDAIKRWFRSIEKEEDIVYLYEAKLVFIGNGQVGKTTIRENLLDKNYGLTQHPSTHGLDTKQWEIPISYEGKDIVFTFNMWDFGGQGRYRVVQQFFCSRNSLYLYVTEPDDDVIHGWDKYVGFPYWLSFISAFSFNRRENRKSPVIYILNKMDKEGVVKIDDHKSISSFDQIKSFVKVSCKTGEGLLELENEVKSHIKETGMVGVAFNKAWLKLKKDLEDRKDDYIHISAYYSLSKSYGIEKEEAKVWLNYLNAIGTILYFPRTLTLKNYVILDPNWARLIAYKVIDSELVEANAGRFRMDDVEEIWGSEIDPVFAIDLLETFELCYKTTIRNDYGEKETEFVFPLLFPTNKSPKYPELEFDEETIFYEYKFKDFLPAGMLSTLMVRRNSLIENNSHYWRNGVLLKVSKNYYAEVIEHWQEKKIEVKFSGNDPIELLILISNELNSIKNKLEVEKNLSELRVLESVRYKNKEVDLRDAVERIKMKNILGGESSLTINQMNIYGGNQQFADQINNTETLKDALRQVILEELKGKII